MSDWFESGLPFTCTACGDCCTGAPGAVWVDDDEVARLAAHLGLATAEFDARHLRRIDGKRSLLEGVEGDCEFFDRTTRACRVYEARPTQCRTYPWWPGNLESPEAWRAVREECEGARVNEPIVPVDAIRAHAAEQRRARDRRG